MTVTAYILAYVALGLTCGLLTALLVLIRAKLKGEYDKPPYERGTASTPAIDAYFLSAMTVIIPPLLFFWAAYIGMEAIGALLDRWVSKPATRAFEAWESVIDWMEGKIR